MRKAGPDCRLGRYSLTQVSNKDRERIGREEARKKQEAAKRLLVPEHIIEK